jgi:tRNA A-37 threonylcarbamoyl transferase component Bud32/tetratricopeptide (TPR) repeat protein
LPADESQHAYPPLPPEDSPAVRALEAILAETPPTGATPPGGPARGHAGSSRVPGTLPQVAGYEILSILGHGGMGIVYKARQPRLNRLVAIKTLLAGSAAGPELLARFRSEAVAAARLQHPNIVQIFEIAEPDGVPFFTMEFVEGGTLEERIRDKPLATMAAAQLVEQLAGAIRAAHEAGVIHRDLKPSNVLLSTDGTPKISDFGLAKRLEEVPGAGGHTRSGAVLGTPNYMAPEQAAAARAAIGPAVDVYALGAILYELLAGKPPFRAADYLQTLEQLRTREPVSPARLRPGLPRDLVAICLKCLEKEPARRYESAADLAADLRRYRNGLPIAVRRPGSLERTLKWARRRPWQAAVAGLLMAAMTATVIGVAWHDHQHRLETERAARAEAETREQKLRVLANLRKGHEALGSLLTQMEDQDERAGDQRTVRLQREVEEATLRYYAGVLGDLDGDPDPDVRLARARVLNYSAEACRLLGRMPDALVKLGDARSILEGLVAERPDNATFRAELADCVCHAADIELARGQPQVAEAGFYEALKLDETNKTQDSDIRAALKNEACCYWRLSSLHESARRVDRAADCAGSAVACWNQLLDNEPGNTLFRSRLGLALKEQIRLNVACGRPREAEAAIVRAVAVLSPMLSSFAKEMDSLWARVWLAEVYREWGLLQLADKRPALEAVEKYTKAIHILDGVLAREPQLLRGRVVQSQLYTYRSMAYRDLGKTREMTRDRERSCAYADGVHHAICQIDFGRDLAAAGDYRRAVAESRAGAADADLPACWRVAVARTCSQALYAVGRDTAVAPAERSRMENEYTTLAFDQLERCRDIGYFADDSLRRELSTDPQLETLRSLPRFQDFVRELSTQAARTGATSASSVRVPAGSK